MTPPFGRIRRRAIIATAAAVLATGALGGPAALAHGPNPLLGSGARWDRDQIVGYQWDPNGVPPAWATVEIDAAAQDIEQSIRSRAATFRRVSSSGNRIYYGILVPCSSYGIACMDRTGVPDSFLGMWFRPHNYPFDWGTLKWCQAMTTMANGCYDVENVALDEFGHMELLGHHVNYGDERDFTDSVVQFAARNRPDTGWNQHSLGRCDVGRLQLEYSLQSSWDAVSSCLSLGASLVIGGPSSVSAGGYVRITGTLKIASASAARELSGDPLSGRTVTLQKRAPGAASWSTVGVVAAGTTAGTYGVTLAVSATTDYRLVYNAPSTEGLIDATSATLRITTTPSGGCGIATKAGTAKPHIIPPGC
jgi:hypothetical protein